MPEVPLMVPLSMIWPKDDKLCCMSEWSWASPSSRRPYWWGRPTKVTFNNLALDERDRNAWKRSVKEGCWRPSVHNRSYIAGETVSSAYKRWYPRRIWSATAQRCSLPWQNIVSSVKNIFLSLTVVMSTKMKLGTEPSKKGWVVYALRFEGLISAVVSDCPIPTPCDWVVELLVDIARKLEVFWWPAWTFTHEIFFGFVCKIALFGTKNSLSERTMSH